MGENGVESATGTGAAAGTSAAARTTEGKEMMDPRLQIVIELIPRHHDQRIVQGGLAALLLLQPDLVEAFTADAAGEVGVQLRRPTSFR